MQKNNTYYMTFSYVCNAKIMLEKKSGGFISYVQRRIYLPVPVLDFIKVQHLDKGAFGPKGSILSILRLPDVKPPC